MVGRLDNPSLEQKQLKKIAQVDSAVLAEVEREVLEALPPAVRDSARGNEIFQDSMRELASDPSLRKLYRTTFIEKDYSALREKSTEQVKAMKHYYLSEASVQLSHEKAKQKAATFLQFVENLDPIRQDTDLSITEFKSPRALGLGRGDGGYDTIVQGGDYVYGSFDGLCHEMAAQSRNQPNVAAMSPEEARAKGTRRLDQAALMNHAEIAMMDVADLLITAKHQNQDLLSLYVSNLHTYAEGKELLVYYLASVFESPEEATALINNSGRYFVEEWDREVKDQSGAHFSVPKEFIESGRIFAIQDRMRKIFARTRMVPPLQLEVRIRDSAQVMPGW